MGAAFAAWVRSVADEQQNRRNALFDAMGRQLRSAQRRCGLRERSDVQRPLLRALLAWHGMVRFGCRQPSCSPAVDWASGRRIADCDASAVMRTLLAWHGLAERSRLVQRLMSASGAAAPIAHEGQADSPLPSTTRGASTPRWSDMVGQEVESPAPRTPQRLFSDAVGCGGSAKHLGLQAVERRPSAGAVAGTASGARVGAPREPRPRPSSSGRFSGGGGARTPLPGAGGGGGTRTPLPGGGCVRPASVCCGGGGGVRTPCAGGGCSSVRMPAAGGFPAPCTGSVAGGERHKFAFVQTAR